MVLVKDRPKEGGIVQSLLSHTHTHTVLPHIHLTKKFCFVFFDQNLNASERIFVVWNFGHKKISGDKTYTHTDTQTQTQMCVQ